jgi:hypothetical protein
LLLTGKVAAHVPYRGGAPDYHTHKLSPGSRPRSFRSVRDETIGAQWESLDVFHVTAEKKSALSVSEKGARTLRTSVSILDKGRRRTTRTVHIKRTVDGKAVAKTTIKPLGKDRDGSQVSIQRGKVWNGGRSGPWSYHVVRRRDGQIVSAKAYSRAVGRLLFSRPVVAGLRRLLYR